MYCTPGPDNSNLINTDIPVPTNFSYSILNHIIDLKYIICIYL